MRAPSWYPYGASYSAVCSSSGFFFWKNCAKSEKDRIGLSPESISSLIGLTGLGLEGRSIGRLSNFPGEGRRGILGGAELVGGIAAREPGDPGRGPRDPRCPRSAP